jgi:ankyrin repeat protein
MAGVDQAGRSELHYAAGEGKVARVRELIDAGEDVRASDHHGMTPLHFAAQEQRAEVARLLLEKGAQMDAEDEHGNTPLWKAVFSSQGNGNVIGILRAAGADPNHANHHGTSPLQLAHQIANYNVAQFFSDISH